MCNLYATMRSRAEVATMAGVIHDLNDNTSLSSVYPNDEALVTFVAEDGQAGGPLLRRA